MSFCVLATILSLAAASAQVKAEVPPVEPGAKPVTLERIKIHGVARQEVPARWAANAPLAFVDQYIGNLKQYRAISIDVGGQDGLRVDAGEPHEVLDTYGVANTFEIYPGTHTSAVAVRIQNFRPAVLRQEPVLRKPLQAMRARSQFRRFV